ncbi:tripartite motif-containing protein 16-like isoform X1 [Takifugu rubripes]|uniref:FinTRIM family, member 83 n=1 Tax=Takifugu rubripes TaxID=31033 RepID=H2SED7_TAKRU|nr:tripartite motif-containing protein 16-like isoform X1 [Takifugu rubripes]|eukprot:XP_003970741.1 PREDICTED: tripartite motif-containing protein 16-like [Takifugu rubripes]
MSSDQDSCYLCKEHLRDPVSIPCGHVFCSICLKTYWDHADHTGSFLCPQCRVTYNKRPTPRRVGGSRYSTLPRDSFPPPPPSPDYNYAGPQDVGCDICIGKKHKAVKTCLMCLASYCEKHLKPHFESATFKRHKLVDEIGHLDRQICPQHQKGLELYCRTDQMCICVLCTVKEHKGHDMVSAEQERAEEQQRLGATQADVQEKIHDRLKQMEELKQAVDALKNSAQRALQECEKTFSDMIRAIERMQQEMAKLISSNKRAALNNAEGHLERLTHEISDLKRRDNEITQLSRTEDHIHFIQSYHMLIAQTEAEELPTVSVNPYFSFGPVTKAVSEMKQHLNEFSNEELVKVAKAVNKMTFCQLDESKKRLSIKGEEAPMYKSVPVQEPQYREDFLRYACQLTLDPNTAYRQLYLSRGNRKATLKRDPQAYHDSAARFDSLPQVLCVEPLSGGAYYWEVDWSGEGAAIGVTYKGIKRAGYGDGCRIGYNRKSWSLFCSDSSYSARHSKDQLEITAPYSSRIGVFLDHAGGTLSFYAVGESMSLIHRFKASFGEPVYPGFWVWYESAITIIQL